MKKRKAAWFVVFLVLILLNLYITVTYIAKLKKVQAAANILSEIDSNYQAQKNIDPATFAYQANFETSDGRSANLKNFFRKYNSPLYDEADSIVKVSDKYKFDYRLLPAIAMQESGLCKAIPSNSYNCWGWGIYGDTVTRFDSYQEAIETVGKGIRDDYINHGLTRASEIMKKYTPSSQGSWAYGVNTFMKALE